MTNHQFTHFFTAGFTGTIYHSPEICETGNGNLRAISEEDFVKTGKLQKRHTVDQLCMDVLLAEKVESVGAWERERSDGLRLSDHSRIYIDLDK